jgi:hypothetical protein
MYRGRIVSLMVRRCADRSGTSAALLLAAVGCAVVLTLTGCSESSRASGAVRRERSTSAGPPPAVPPPAGATYTLMQMNLCLSGLASCFGKVAYPAVVEEAVARIRDTHPDAVTFNEACGSDVRLIARRTGYHLRFSRVIYQGEPLPCIHPGGRGLFGDAVLTKAAIESTDSQAFEAQAGPERRQWLCVSTRVAVDCAQPTLPPTRPMRWPRMTRSAPSCGGSFRVARPPARSSSGATSTVTTRAPLTASGPAPTGPPTRTPASNRSTEATRSARPRRRWCPPRTLTTTSCWSARTSPHDGDSKQHRAARPSDARSSNFSAARVFVWRCRGVGHRSIDL